MKKILLKKSVYLENLATVSLYDNESCNPNNNCDCNVDYECTDKSCMGDGCTGNHCYL